MDRVHPREEYTEEEPGKKQRTKLRKRRICATRTGCHWCTPSFRKSDLAEYGMGMVIYFQFVKYMACMYCMMTVISIPAMIFYFSGKPAQNFEISSIVPALSLGNIGQSETACASGTFDTTS